MDEGTKETSVFIESRRDLRQALAALDAAGIEYRTEPWQKGITAVYFAADADVSAIFGPGR